MPWQLLTYGFLHGNLTHIAFNMFGLWMFGQDLERLWGPKRFLNYFLVCVVGAGIIQLLVAGFQGGLYPTVGASGGLFGLLLAYGLTFPNRIVVPLFPPIPSHPSRCGPSLLSLCSACSSSIWASAAVHRGSPTSHTLVVCSWAS
jgi:membrane associated rhomboid family serine protease